MSVVCHKRSIKYCFNMVMPACESFREKKRSVTVQPKGAHARVKTENVCLQPVNVKIRKDRLYDIFSFNTVAALTGLTVQVSPRE